MTKEKNKNVTNKKKRNIKYSEQKSKKQKK